MLYRVNQFVMVDYQLPKVRSRRMNRKTTPWIVAEISGNHNGSYQSALSLIKSAKDAGADAVKIQTYTPDTITLPIKTGAFTVSPDHALWGSRTLYDLYQEAHTPWEWHQGLFEYARELNITLFSTPFDETAVDFLEALGCPIYKIASLEIVDIPLINYAAKTQKPLIISTGAATIEEIEYAVDAARESGCKDLTLLICTSAYPAKPEEANLKRMKFLEDKFGVRVGLSDHTTGLGTSIAASVLGASIIEKHLSQDEDLVGVDARFSMSASDFANLVQGIHDAVSSLGISEIWQTASEKESIRLRPSLYICKDVKEGDLVSYENVKSLRPSGGLPPVEIYKVIGLEFNDSLPIGTPLKYDVLKPPSGN